MANATDDSGMVQVLGSHEPGDNFNLGVTAVHYEASDPSGSTASCSFTVTVEDTENPHIICPPDATVTASLGNPTTQVIWPMPKASDNSGTVQVLGSHEPGDNFNIGVTAVHYEASDLQETQLHAMDTDIAALHLSAEVNDDRLIDKDVLIETIINTTDDLAKFILKNIEPGSGPVVLDTPSIRFALESDSVDRLTNRSIMMGDGNGFSLPAADKLFSNLAQGESTLNMIVVCIRRRSFQADNVKDAFSEFDILSLTFTDRENSEIEVTGTQEDIRITFTSDSDVNIPHTKLESFYSETDNVTHFGTVFEVSRPFHAIVITLQNSEPMHGKSVAFVFDRVVTYSNGYHGYQFTVDVELDGNNSKIFIPEHYIMRTGKYFLAFSIPEDVEIPSIECPSDVDVVLRAGKSVGSVDWQPPTATDNSDTLTLTTNHEPRSAFPIGETVVTYNVADLSSNDASCSFTITVRDIIQAMNTNIAALHSSAEVDNDRLINNGLLIENIMDTTDDLSNFILNNIEPGSGPVVLDTPSIRLTLESDSVERLANRSIMMGDGNGFSLPAADKLFSDIVQGEGTLNMIVS
ncbi:hyalin-like [Ptychodera flava]|uniref:hyalin-like n=1 Tax=Ptychodera flava TaxID=63121 RepID=UPI00396A78E2